MDPQQMYQNLPSALVGSMAREKKPFTYLPGGLDFSEIRSPRMAKRLAKHQAHIYRPEGGGPPSRNAVAPMSHINGGNPSNLPTSHHQRQQYQQENPAPAPAPHQSETQQGSNRPEFRKQRSISELLSFSEPDGVCAPPSPLPLTPPTDPYNPYSSSPRPSHAPPPPNTNANIPPPPPPPPPSAPEEPMPFTLGNKSNSSLVSHAHESLRQEKEDKIRMERQEAALNACQSTSGDSDPRGMLLRQVSVEDEERMRREQQEFIQRQREEAEAEERKALQQEQDTLQRLEQERLRYEVEERLKKEEEEERLRQKEEERLQEQEHDRLRQEERERLRLQEEQELIKKQQEEERLQEQERLRKEVVIKQQEHKSLKDPCQTETQETAKSTTNTLPGKVEIMPETLEEFNKTAEEMSNSRRPPLPKLDFNVLPVPSQQQQPSTAKSGGDASSSSLLGFDEQLVLESMDENEIMPVAQEGVTSLRLDPAQLVVKGADTSRARRNREAIDEAMVRQRASLSPKPKQQQPLPTLRLASPKSSSGNDQGEKPLFSPATPPQTDNLSPVSPPSEKAKDHDTIPISTSVDNDLPKPAPGMRKKVPVVKPGETYVPLKQQHHHHQKQHNGEPENLPSKSYYDPRSEQTHRKVVQPQRQTGVQATAPPPAPFMPSSKRPEPPGGEMLREIPVALEESTNTSFSPAPPPVQSSAPIQIPVRVVANSSTMPRRVAQTPPPLRMPPSPAVATMRRTAVTPPPKVTPQQTHATPIQTTPTFTANEPQSPQALLYGSPGSWNRANTSQSVREELGFKGRERIIPIHIERGPTTVNQSRPRETAPSYNRSLSDVDYQKGSRKAVVDEINSHSHSRLSASDIAGPRSQPYQSPSLRLLAQIHGADSMQHAGDDLTEQVVTAREYSGGQGRYLPPKGPRRMPEQSLHYQTMPFCQQSEAGGFTDF